MQFRDRYCPLTDELGYQWKSYLPTPPFPGYVSGHAATCTAGSDALASFFGTDTIPGGPLTFTIPKGGSFFEPYCPVGSACYKKCSIDPRFDSTNSFTPQQDFTLVCTLAPDWIESGV